ncbi:MAG: histidine phosphatase family protein [Phycisphaerae bacterium]
MSQIYLVTWGPTEWEAQGRITGDTDVPLSDEGRRRARQSADELRQPEPPLLYRGPEEPARETAAALASAWGVRARVIKTLREVNLGHWAGLTQAEFEEGFESVAREWRENPAAVQPPAGELLTDALARLEAALVKVAKKARDGVAVVVIGPLATAALRLRIEGAGLSQLWERIEERRAWTAVSFAPAARPRGHRQSAP